MAVPTKADLQAEIERLEQELTTELVREPSRPPLDMGVVERLIMIGKEVGPTGKQTMKGVGYDAFAIDDIYSKLRPLFSKWEVVIVPTMRQTEYVVTPRVEKSPAVDAHVWIDYSFYSPDGSHVTMTFSAEGRDFGDKATNKAVQQAFKYGLIQMFMISTGEVDPDAEHGEIEGQHLTSTPDEAEPKPVPEPATDLLMKQVKDHAWLLTKDVEPESYRVEETKLLLEQELAAYGRNPEDDADAQAIMANMNVTMATTEEEAT
jgi:hypothetical protein